MNLSFKCEDVKIEGRHVHQIDVEATDVDVDDVCNEVINTLSVSDVISIINDEDACMRYFNLKPVDGE